MDLSLIISLIALLSSVITPILIAWLTVLRGPDLTLIEDPKFELTDEGFKKRGTIEYTPYWFELKPVSFVFANNGRNAGTIVDLRLEITPHESIRNLYEGFHVTFGTYDKPDLPAVIAEGDIGIIQASITLNLINWKKNALAEVLDANLEIKALVAKALERSKEQFTNFCDFLNSGREIGYVTCTANLSKGNDLKEETIGEYKISNNYDEALSSLRGCLRKWKNIGPPKNELLNELESSFRELKREIKANIEVAKKTVTEKTINKSKLRLDAWKRLQTTSGRDREVRCFLIKSKGLEEALTKLYRKTMDYNSLVEESLYRGNQRTVEEVQQIDTERKRILLELTKTNKIMTR